LGIRRVLIPSGAGVGSAIGFLRAPIAFEVVGSELRPLVRMEPAAIERRLQAMQEQALSVVAPASAGAPLEITRLAELRYAGQGHELRVRMPAAREGAITRETLQGLGERFEQAYEKVYGLRIPGCEVEVVTWSVTVSTPTPPAQVAPLAPADAARAPEATRECWEAAAGARQPFGLHWRFDLQARDAVQGPALVAEDETTVVVPAGWRAQLDSHGHLRMEVAA
jgi:N-methylhydantoinase A